jgi:4-hydroxybenzoate polyprenyltransferase
MTFLGSLYNEILADMRDMEGDRKNNIYTIPVIFGITNTWYISCALLNFNVIMNTFSMYYLYNSVAIASCIPFLFFPMMRELYKVKYLKYQRDSIINATSISNITLFGMVLYICVLASLP